MKRSVFHIAGFFAVGFVLAFLGRINKTDLYHTFFRTIQDVEIRNSQALSYVDVPTLQDFSMEDTRARLGNWLSFFSFLDFGSFFELHPPKWSIKPIPEQGFAYVNPFRFSTSGLPNAPPLS